MLAALWVCGSIVSCKKFLDQQPVSETPEGALFNNPNNALRAVLGVYAAMTGTNGYGAWFSLVYPFDSDEIIGYQAGAATDDQRRMNSYDIIPTNAYLANGYNRLYAGIERANICIKNIPAMDKYNNGTETEQRDLKRMYGEALALRAFYYGELIKIWGDVPAIYEPSYTYKNFDIPKTDRDLIYDKILDDLAIAANLVPWITQLGSTNDERLSKGAVKAIRARIALFRGGYSLRRDSRQMERRPDYLKYYTIAHDECRDIMLSGYHGLNNSFQGVWKDYVMNGQLVQKEVLFEVAMGGNTANSDSQFGTWNGIRMTLNGTAVGQTRSFVLPTLFYKYSPFDLRRDVSIAPFNVTEGNIVGQTLLTARDGKWRVNWISPLPRLMQYYGINWPIIRYSDVLLMFAEASNELETSGVPSPEAVNAVNQVRRRAFGAGAIKSITVTNGGSGYTNGIITISGGGGSGAVAVATVSGGSITAVDIITPGSGYTSTPTFTFTGGTGATVSVTRTTADEADLAPAQTASKEAFLAAIQDERLFEFVSEGIRKYDLIRWNLLAIKIAETKAELQKMVNREAPYNTYPLTMLYKSNSTELSWGNSFYKTTSPTSLTGYTSVGWLSSLSKTALVDKFAANFTPNKSELYPMATTVIQAAHGALTQDYGY